VEIHAFLNLLHQLDFFVATKDQAVWKIDAGDLERIQ